MTEQKTTNEAGQLRESEELEALDRRAREALDELADKREELARRHRATDLAAGRQREREEERRREREREAREREERRRREKLEAMATERLALEERAEEQSAALIATLGELLALDRRHRQALGPFSVRAGEAPPPDLPREISAWFRGRFGAVVPGLGSDYRAAFGSAGPSLPERDPLTSEGRRARNTS